MVRWSERATAHIDGRRRGPEGGGGDPRQPRSQAQSHGKIPLRLSPLTTASASPPTPSDLCQHLSRVTYSLRRVDRRAPAPRRGRRHRRRVTRSCRPLVVRTDSVHATRPRDGRALARPRSFVALGNQGEPCGSGLWRRQVRVEWGAEEARPEVARRSRLDRAGAAWMSIRLSGWLCERKRC